MTKLFSRTFASSPEDPKLDQEISEKISLLQNFLRPEHLDIPAVLQNEASWLVCVLPLFSLKSLFNSCVVSMVVPFYLVDSRVSMLLSLRIFIYKSKKFSPSVCYFTLGHGIFKVTIEKMTLAFKQIN